jgi:hypothetical protein
LIKKFSNLGELERYALKTQDHELSGKIKIVRTHHVNLLSHINRILSKCVKDNKVAGKMSWWFGLWRLAPLSTIF